MNHSAYPVARVGLAEELHPDRTSTVGRRGRDVHLNGALVAGINDIVVAVVVRPYRAING